jgi:hypothetical protein
MGTRVNDLRNESDAEVPQPGKYMNNGRRWFKVVHRQGNSITLVALSWHEGLLVRCCLAVESWWQAMIAGLGA